MSHICIMKFFYSTRHDGNIPQKVLLVEDVVNNTKDQLEFRDRVVKMSLGKLYLFEKCRAYVKNVFSFSGLQILIMLYEYLNRPRLHVNNKSPYQ